MDSLLEVRPFEHAYRVYDQATADKKRTKAFDGMRQIHGDTRNHKS